MVVGMEGTGATCMSSPPQDTDSSETAPTRIGSGSGAMRLWDLLRNEFLSAPTHRTVLRFHMVATSPTRSESANEVAADGIGAIPVQISRAPARAAEPSALAPRGAAAGWTSRSHRSCGTPCCGAPRPSNFRWNVEFRPDRFAPVTIRRSKGDQEATGATPVHREGRGGGPASDPWAGRLSGNTGLRTPLRPRGVEPNCSGPEGCGVGRRRAGSHLRAERCLFGTLAKGGDGP